MRLGDKAFVVDCGDKRFDRIFSRLTAGGYAAEKYDLSADYSRRGDVVFLFAPQSVFPAGVSDDATVFSYKPAEVMSMQFPSAKAHFLNYLDDNALAVKNARYTAEGALALMISNTKVSMWEMRTAVFGGGRVGKAVLRLLKQNGIYCALASRDADERAFARAMETRSYDLCEIDEALDSFDCVINSIPSIIFNGGRLDLLKRDCYLLDLASAPGGTDFVYAQKLGINAVNALGLPGKYCPYAAADDLYASILARV